MKEVQARALSLAKVANSNDRLVAADPRNACTTRNSQAGADVGSSSAIDLHRAFTACRTIVSPIPAPADTSYQYHGIYRNASAPLAILQRLCNSLVDPIS